MTPQELKNSILQLAIQGKLVEQRPEEGTAEELYKQIQAEKQALIKAGKLKKEKPLPEITEDEMPFEIPESWKWVRFCQLSQLLDGEKKQEEKLPYLEAKFLRGKSDAQYITEGKFVKKDTKVILVDGENSGEVFNIPIDGYMGSTFKILYFSTVMLEQYVLMFLLYHKNDYRNNKRGAAIPHLNKNLFFNMPIPIPPLKEQERIVARIEELLPLIDRYEQAWNRLEDLNKRFPGDLQKSILQLAIQGKLTDQRPEEGTGEELYQQIQAEKQALIKAGKLKKEKPLPAITEAEIPFDIPESWKWIQMGEICSIVTGRLDANAKDPNGEFEFFTCGVEVYKTKSFAFDCDAILLGGNNASGDYKMHRFKGKFNAYQRVYVISDPPKETLDYLYYTIKWWLPSLKKNSQGTTTRFIKLEQVTGMLIPLPPIGEQKRIIERFELLFPLCSRMT